jgi:galactokinase/mevalonate kinase-like predicted kinase
LDIEKNELGIAAGLQDRVVQTYGGLVFMDFSLLNDNNNNINKNIDNISSVNNNKNNTFDSEEKPQKKFEKKNLVAAFENEKKSIPIKNNEIIKKSNFLFKNIDVNLLPNMYLIYDKFAGFFFKKTFLLLYAFFAVKLLIVLS